LSPVRVLVVMGVSGAGKSTVGALLAKELGWGYAEGDAFHPPANVAKMSQGIPLGDDDRLPWLQAIGAAIGGWLEEGRPMVVTCSALRQRYRDILKAGRPEVGFVHLAGAEALIALRLQARKGHFMPPGLLRSQFDALEPPDDAIRVEIDPPPEEIVGLIRRRLEGGGD
jgi:gluconokinase